MYAACQLRTIPLELDSVLNCGQRAVRPAGPIVLGAVLRDDKNTAHVVRSTGAAMVCILGTEADGVM